MKIEKVFEAHPKVDKVYVVDGKYPFLNKADADNYANAKDGRKVEEVNRESPKKTTSSKAKTTK